MNDLTSDELFDYLVQEAEANFAGWDFSYISERYVSAALPWLYDMKVWPKIRRANSLLDMDTGGGEKLAKFQPLPNQTYATEAYAPNVPVAQQKLAPLGVTVVEVADDDGAHLPFGDDFFDLVINRHGAYKPQELHRVMKPGGHFITQQVGDQNNQDYPALFGISADTNQPAWNMAVAIDELEAAGFEVVEQKEDLSSARIYDVGAIVYYLKAIPWTLPDIPDFSVDQYFEQLKAIHQMIEQNDYIEIGEHRFFISAKKAS